MAGQASRGACAGWEASALGDQPGEQRAALEGRGWGLGRAWAGVARSLT